ncbi:MAG: stage V sporulation protein AC [Oscillospiraceae bacterium]|nr:stage V sporulation protein AC [Oscillospiraceae bacterium]
MQVTPELYQDMQKQAVPRSNSKVNVLMAFLTGGTVCTIGQILFFAFQNLGFSQEQSMTWTSVTLVICSALLTGLGIYEKMAKHAGAGTLVPITGFANAIASSAIESKTEGYILGIGTKIFTIAGPVILYGTASSVIYGLLYYLIQRI